MDYNNSEEEMEKNFQLRITKKYVLLGFSKEQIAEFAKKSGKLPKLTSVQEDRVKMIRKDEGIQLNHFAVGKKAGRPAKVTKEAIDSNINENGEEPEKASTRKKKADKPDSTPVRYPWQDADGHDRAPVARPVLGRAVPVGAGHGLSPDLAGLPPTGLFPAVARALRPLPHRIQWADAVAARGVGR